MSQLIDRLKQAGIVISQCEAPPPPKRKSLEDIKELHATHFEQMEFFCLGMDIPTHYIHHTDKKGTFLTIGSGAVNQRLKKMGLTGLNTQDIEHAIHRGKLIKTGQSEKGTSHA